MSKCQYCGLSEATQQHHIFGGHGTRPVADEYGLVVSLCVRCHKLCHDQKRYMQERICVMLGLDYESLNIIMRKPSKQWTMVELAYMQNVKGYMQRKHDK